LYRIVSFFGFEWKGRARLLPSLRILPRIRAARTESRPPRERGILMMRWLARGWSLALLSVCFLGLAGCSEDNEAFIREQKSRVKITVPRARAAQAQTQEEFYEITPGVKGGVGTRVGPVPDQGPGYPGAPKK
jgi:hypothetical protein